MTRFQGSTVVVTGAGSGIGFEMARLFAEEGGTVFAVDRDISGIPESAVGVEGDVSKPDDVHRFVERAVSETGRIDVLCNNAGIGSTADVISCTPEDWDEIFAVNVRGVFLGIRAAMPHMLRQGGGAIVNTASVAGLLGLVDRASYCASKGAVVALTKQVAVQYARTGVRCNCVCPGTVDSPWVARLLAGAEDPVATREALVARQPMGRLGQAEEVAHAALYLASPQAAFVTGAALVIDGGLVAG